MYRPRTAVLPGMGTTTPVGDVSATEWKPVQEEALLSMTRTYDSRAYATIQDAIDAAEAAGGGTVFVGDTIPPGQDIELKDGVYLAGRGVGVTDINVNTISGTGSVSPLPGMQTAMPIGGSRTVTFVADPGLVPGDVFVIYNPTDFSFSPARSYYRAGEFCRVKSVSGNTVTLTRPTYAGYSPASVTLYKLNPIRTGVSNMTVRCTQGKTGIKVTYGTDLVFNNLSLMGTNVSHLSLSRCYNIDIDNVKAFDASVEVGTNYGISIINCQRMRINNVDLETTRHGLTLTGEGVATVCTVPNRDIRISDSYINGMSDGLGVCGCNLHGNSEYISFSNVTMPSGVNPAGDHISFSDCSISTPSWGSAISCMEMLGVNLTLDNCRFTATDSHRNVRGMLYFFFGEHCVRSFGIFTFKNNVVDLGNIVSDGVQTMCAYILTTSTVGGTKRYAYISDNVFETPSGTLTNKVSVSIRSDTGMDQWTRIDYINNGGRLQPRFNRSETLVFFDGYGSAIPSFAAAPGSRYMRRVNAGTGGGKLYVNENGDTTWTVK